MTQTLKIPVSERALFARLSRALAKDGEILKKCRPDSRWFSDLGAYYTVDASNHISATHIDLEEWARDQGVLRQYEILKDE